MSSSKKSKAGIAARSMSWRQIPEHVFAIPLQALSACILDGAFQVAVEFYRLEV